MKRETSGKDNYSSKHKVGNNTVDAFTGESTSVKIIHMNRSNVPLIGCVDTGGRTSTRNFSSEKWERSRSMSPLSSSTSTLSAQAEIERRFSRLSFLLNSSTTYEQSNYFERKSKQVFMDRSAQKIDAGIRENTFYDPSWMVQKTAVGTNSPAKPLLRTPFASIPFACDIEGYSANPVMGWGQPNCGKRLRDPQQTDRDRSSGFSNGTSESETDEELRMHLVHKRSRDVSPLKSSHGVTDLVFGSPHSLFCNQETLKTSDTSLDDVAKTFHEKYGVTDCWEDRMQSDGDGVHNTPLNSEEPSRRIKHLCNDSNHMDHPVCNGTKDLESANELAPETTDIQNEMPNSTRKALSSSSSSTSLSKFRGLKVSAARRGRLSYRKYLSPPRNKAAEPVKGVNSEDEEETESEMDDSTVEDLINFKGESVEEEPSSSADLSISDDSDKDIAPIPAIRPSYFAYVPPYINFCSHDEKAEQLPNEIAKHLKWRLSTITPIVIRKTVTNTGFRLLRKTVEWGGQWGKHMKSTMFRSSLKDYQKLNHMPSTFQLGRKDRLWKNIYRFILKYGKNQFGFLPRTFVLPNDMKQLKHIWNNAEAKGNMWIIKPPAAARGTGIRVVSKWNQVPKKRPVIVQQYIAKPLLINDRKFDLRLYVLVTSANPLRMYLFEDGLVRFAPVKYCHDVKRVSDRFMHLTNYSVNKNCELYTQNEDANACKGHKWTLKSLWRYLQDNGKDPKPIIAKIEDIVIKTFLSAEDCISNNTFNLPNKYCGYELFGFDIILDENLKPWLLEVNISPSLHSSSPLDLAVKGPLIKEVFNIVGYHLPPTLSKSAKKMFIRKLDQELVLEKPTFDKRLYSMILSKDERQKQSTFKPKFGDRSEYLDEILTTLTPDDVRQLIVAEDELSQCKQFRRIFPTTETHTYFGYFEGPRYYNMLMDAWETKYGNKRGDAISRLQALCLQKLHLITEPSPPKPTLSNQDIAEAKAELKPGVPAPPPTSIAIDSGSKDTTIMLPESFPQPVVKLVNLSPEVIAIKTRNLRSDCGREEKEEEATATAEPDRHNVSLSKAFNYSNVIQIGEQEDSKMDGNSLNSSSQNSSAQTNGVVDFAHLKRMCC